MENTYLEQAAVEEAFSEWRSQFPQFDQLLIEEELLSTLGELPMLELSL